MKHGHKPTVAQCEIISSFRRKGQALNPANWLVVKNLPDKLVIVHRGSAATLEIPK